MKLTSLREPKLRFGFSQAMEDPRTGLALFGPLDGGPYGVRWGLIGPRSARERMIRWVRKIQQPVVDPKPRASRPYFPGFEAAFGVRWDPTPAVEIDVPERALLDTLWIGNRHERVYKTVEQYFEPIARTVREDEASVDVWFVVIPDDVYKYGRPLSNVEKDRRVASAVPMSRRFARELKVSPSLFKEDNEAARAFEFEPHFHNQMKARLLKFKAPTQVVRESTVAFSEILRPSGRPLHDYTNLQSAIAWNLATTTFYKCAGRPWKLEMARDGVCYLGLVFKQDDRAQDRRMACCAAQMFLDSGDGFVFRGAIGPWYSPDAGFHVSRRAAKDLISVATRTYFDKHGQPPAEIFIHGRTRFNDEEWAGFLDGVGAATRVVGVCIKSSLDVKLFTPHKGTTLRGLAMILDARKAYLWSRGYVPRLETYVGTEVPNPLSIEITRGDADINMVLADVLALTKLNYNACVYGDGRPVTLKFADAVGEILTAGPQDETPPLPFKHYI